MNSMAALKRIVALMDDPKAGKAVQLAAAMAVLDRAFGKPRQTVDVEQQGRTLEEILLAIAATHDEEQAQERAGGERPAVTAPASPLSVLLGPRPAGQRQRVAERCGRSA